MKESCMKNGHFRLDTTVDNWQDALIVLKNQGYRTATLQKVITGNKPELRCLLIDGVLEMAIGTKPQGDVDEITFYEPHEVPSRVKQLCNLIITKLTFKFGKRLPVLRLDFLEDDSGNFYLNEIELLYVTLWLNMFLHDGGQPMFWRELQVLLKKITSALLAYNPDDVFIVL